MLFISGNLVRLCLCFALALLGCCLTGSDAEAQTIVALGDSNTAGWGVGQTNAFPSQLNTMLQRRGYQAKIVNAGITGDTLGGMLSRLDNSVPAGTRLVIVQGGYNDVIRWTPPNLIVERLRGILARLHARRVPAVLCGFFDPKWDAIGRKLSAQYGARFVPGSTCYSPNHRGPDGLHMSAAGHTVIAQRLMPVIASSLSAPRGQVAQPATAAAPNPAANP